MEVRAGEVSLGFAKEIAQVAINLVGFADKFHALWQMAPARGDMGSGDEGGCQEIGALKGAGCILSALKELIGAGKFALAKKCAGPVDPAPGSLGITGAYSQLIQESLIALELGMGQFKITADLGLIGGAEDKFQGFCFLAGGVQMKA